MMRITLKLFATLERYLPDGSGRTGHNEAQVEMPEGASVAAALRTVGVPREEAHLVLVDGKHLPPERLEEMKLEEGQTLAVWPPVAGG